MDFNNGNGIAAHFYHANGFPLEIYSGLLTKLSQHLNLSALALRPTWPNIGLPPKQRSWQIYADDLIDFLERQNKGPVIGIGHSMGATCTVLAAKKRPDLFKSLVLIEPAMVSSAVALLVRIFPKAFVNLFNPAKNALKKPDKWDSRQAFLSYCKQFRGYKRFDDEMFSLLAKYGVTETRNGQYQLSFPKIWEAHNYTQPPNLMTSLEKLKMPCIAIRGKPSIFVTESIWQEWRSRCPHFLFKENLDYGHLFPLENPSACYDILSEALTELSLMG